MNPQLDWMPQQLYQLSDYSTSKLTYFKSHLQKYTPLYIFLLYCSLSKEGRIIIMSIHQPRYSIFRLFDHLTLLSRGEIVYHGKSKGALPYFSGVLSEYRDSCYFIPVSCHRHLQHSTYIEGVKGYEICIYSILYDTCIN